MVKEEYIRDYNSQLILGIIETMPNGDQVARDFPSRLVLGYYRASRNVTTDFPGRVVSTGNTVVQFIYRKQR